MGNSLGVVAFDVLGKTSGLLAVAGVVHWGLGRRRALVRSSLWNGVLLGLILIPAASLAFPRWNWPILAAPPADRPMTRVATDQTPARVERPPLPRVARVEAAPVVASGEAPSGLDMAPEPAGLVGWHWDLGRIVLGVYLVVVTAGLIRLAVALRAVGRLRRAGRPLLDPTWVAAVTGWRVRLGVRRVVTIRESSRVAVPLVVGWWRPTILVPAGLSPTANPDLIDSILVHELAHVRRGDYGWNLVRAVVQTCYWPDPLTWPLRRIMGSVREQACDDLCVGILGGSGRYRASLLAVAAYLVACRPTTPAIGLAMARPGHLAGRLAWIDQTRGAATCLLRWPARLAVLAGVAMLAGTLGAIELAHAQSARPPQQALPVAQLAGQPAVVEVEIRAHDTGQPLVGATVQCHLDHRRVDATTDPAGKVRVNLVGLQPTATLNIDVWKNGYVQQRYFFADNDAGLPRIPSQITITLWPGEETLGGRVVDVAGQPVEGVKVRVWGYLGAMKDPHELAYMVDATTNQQGEWRCRDFRQMKFAYLYLAHPDYLADTELTPRRHGQPSSASPPPPDTMPMAALRDFSDVQVLRRGVEGVTGTVVDERGKAIAAAEVAWFPGDQLVIGRTELWTTTDGAGVFQFRQVRPGRIFVLARAPGHAPELKLADAGPGMGPIAVTLGPPHTLLGRVVDSQGRPIADASMRVDAWRNTQGLDVSLKTDRDGRFRWDDAPADLVTITVTCSGFLESRWQQVVAGGDEIVVQLNRSVRVAGMVRDSATGQTVANSRAWIGKFNPIRGGFQWRSDRSLLRIQGRFSGTIDAERNHEFRVRIEADGYEPFESSTLPTDGGPVRLDVKLIRRSQAEERTVAGLVRGPDGKPLAGAQVALTYSEASDLEQRVRIENGKIKPPPRQTTVPTTDAEGRFSLQRNAGLDGKVYAVVVVHPGSYARVDHAAFEADPVITTRPWGRIEGIAQRNGQPAPGVAVEAWNDLQDFDETRIDAQTEIRADAAGRFTVERVPPGDVRVTTLIEQGDERLPENNGEIVKVESGQTTRVALNNQGRPVVARVAVPAGFEARGADSRRGRVWVESETSSQPLAFPPDLLARGDGSALDWGKRWWTSTAGYAFRRSQYQADSRLLADGTMRLNDVPPGRYEVTITASNSTSDGVGGTISRTATATRKFTVPPLPDGRTDEPLDLGTIRLEPEPPQSVYRSGMGPSPPPG